MPAAAAPAAPERRRRRRRRGLRLGLRRLRPLALPLALRRRLPGARGLGRRHRVPAPRWCGPRARPPAGSAPRRPLPSPPAEGGTKGRGLLQTTGARRPPVWGPLGAPGLRPLPEPGDARRKPTIEGRGSGSEKKGRLGVGTRV